MKKQFTHIAMLCNKEQFEAIKPKLEKSGMEINSVTCFNSYPYLINYDNGNKLSNINKYIFEDKMKHAEEIHETWNERIFLEACGIEIKETFEITKETIVKYQMKDEFPEVFDVKLKVGKWYKTKSNCLFNLNKITDKFYLGYGFTKSMTYYSEFNEYIRTELKEATKQEVFEALKNEAVKRYENKFINPINANIMLDYNNKWVLLELNKSSLDDDNRLWCRCGQWNAIVFDNGKWATIIQTKTKEEADKLLNCKIIN